MAQRSSDITRTDAGDQALTQTGPDTSSLVDGTDNDSSLLADDTSEQTDTIKARIEETRADMGETIDAIQEKLSLSNISEQVSEQVNNAIETAKHTVYDATLGKVVDLMKNTGREISNSSVVATAKDNPLPLLLIGLGAGLLAYQSYSKKNGRSRGAYRAPQQLRDRSDYGRGGQSIADTTGGGLRTVKDTVSTAAGTAYDGVARAAGSAMDGVTKVAGSTYSGAGELAHRAREKAGDLGTKAQETYSHYLEEKPWAIGAVALVAGAAIGMAIPSTRYEGELMGEARLNLLKKVQDSATEFIDKAKEAATNAGQAISDEAKTLTEETLS